MRDGPTGHRGDGSRRDGSVKASPPAASSEVVSPAAATAVRAPTADWSAGAASAPAVIAATIHESSRPNTGATNGRWDRLCERSRDEHLDGEDGATEQYARRHRDRRVAGRGQHDRRRAGDHERRQRTAKDVERPDQHGERYERADPDRDRHRGVPVVPVPELARQPHQHDCEEAGEGVDRHDRDDRLPA